MRNIFSKIVNIISIFPILDEIYAGKDKHWYFKAILIVCPYVTFIKKKLKSLLGL